MILKCRQRRWLPPSPLLALTTAPVINSPAAVLATGRGENAKRFSGLPGIVTPIIATLPREQLSRADAANIA